MLKGNELSARLCLRFDFPVRFTRDVLAPSNPALASLLLRMEPARPQRVFFVLDAGASRSRRGLAQAAAAYARARKGTLDLAAPPLVVEGGRRCAARAEAREWLRARMAAACQGGEPCHVVAIGGGCLLDAAGWAAASLYGGLRVTRVPTTLAAQSGFAASCEAGVEAFGRAEAGRVVAPPFGVLNDSRFLERLPPAMRFAGLAECLRLALARDAGLFHWMLDSAGALARGNAPALETAARWSFRLYIDAYYPPDYARPGWPKPTEFGRWAARALERLGSLPAHQAAAVGIAIDLHLSSRLRGLSPRAAAQACALLERMGLPLWDDALETAIAQESPFEENLRRWRGPGRGAAILLLDDLGQAVEVSGVEEQALWGALEALRRRTRGYDHENRQA